MQPYDGAEETIENSNHPMDTELATLSSAADMDLDEVDSSCLLGVFSCCFTTIIKWSVPSKKNMTNSFTHATISVSDFLPVFFHLCTVSILRELSQNNIRIKCFIRICLDYLTAKVLHCFSFVRIQIQSDVNSIASQNTFMKALDLNVFLVYCHVFYV
ncbi:hypothetical protein BD560DRAFT_426857 [Blakeslea trispora]|nr:hypothetical protein BD560DRAFT_426857 [Blakeslea trispora]